MKRFLLVLSLLVALLPLRAQTTFISPYRLHWGIETGIAAPAIGLNIAHFVLAKKLPPLDSTSVVMLNPQNVPKFDRLPTRLWSKPAAYASDALMYTSFAAPSLLFIDKNIRKDWYKVGAIWAETFALTAGVTNLTKVLTHRSRPYTYNPNAPWDKKMERDARYSFFSGHASMTASMCFMTAKIYTDYYPKSKALPWVWASAAIVPAITGILRVRAGKHFPSDVIVGYLVGASIGVLIPTLHKIKF